MRPRQEVNSTPITWAASGAISQDIAKPYTITRLVLNARLNITTTSATNFVDYWDRMIANLSITGGGLTYASFTNMRAPYHMARFAGFAPLRPTVIPDSQTGIEAQFLTVLHFGLQPQIMGADGRYRDNPWDLTAGLPPTTPGNLTLGGAFGSATVMGTSCTINSGKVDLYFYGVEGALPAAIPQWNMGTLDVSATNSQLSTAYNIPAGDYLRSILVTLTRGSNYPRDDQVLNSLSLFDAYANKTIVTYGGQTGAVLEGIAMQHLSQYGIIPTPPPSDDTSTALTYRATTTPGKPDILHGSDAGLVWIPMEMFAWNGDPMYGADLRGIGIGDLQLKYGVNNATTTAATVLTRKYRRL